MKTWIPLLAALLIAVPLHAQPVTPTADQASVMSEGVVRKIDAANGKITIKHGPLANLNMSAMTMVFRVQPVELLNTVKVGDKVRFHAEQIDDVLSVTAIEPVR
jgi:Cu/Ag efflux protein CusF